MSLSPLAKTGGNLAGLARWAMETFGDRPAMELETGESLSFRGVAERSAAIAQQLAGAGIGANDIVAVALGSCTALPLHIIAAAHLGASVVPLNPTLTSTELTHVLEMTDPALVVTTTAYADAHREGLVERGVRVLDERGHDPDGRAVDMADARDLGATPMLDLPVRFGLTSGSTGVPKAVIKTQRQWVLDGHALATTLNLGPADRVVSAQPLYYGDPFMLLMACLQTGASCVYLARFRSDSFIAQVAHYRATKFVTIGSMPAMLLNAPKASTDRDHGASAAWSVGIPRQLHRALEERFGLPWLELYGLSETGLVLGQDESGPREVGAGWLGRPAPGMRLRLVSEADGVGLVEGDGVGILDVRGPTVVAGYHNRPDATVEAVRDGWFRTGDVLERQGEQFRYVRRIKDIVRRSGENLSCQEIEQVLRRCDGVVDAAVIPRPDEIRGEEVWAFVQMQSRPESSDEIRALAARLAQHASLRLARQKVPRYMTFVDSFERTPSERIVKRRLGEQTDTDRTVDLGEGRRRDDTARR